jgi:hypothetical protein
MDAFVQERFGGFKESACEDDDRSGSITGFDILGFGNFYKLNKMKDVPF